MSDQLPPPLRNDGNTVTVITADDGVRPVLGTARPDEMERRLKVLRQWGGSMRSPRAQAMATIDEPLPQRTQTILSYEVSAELRQRLNGGLGAPPLRAPATPASAPRVGPDADD